MSLDISLRHRFVGVSLDIAFTAPSPGVTVVFGPSGAGKSTTLAAIAGLLRPDACRIAVDGTLLADTGSGIWLAPERRGVGLVFQDARLFPHMSVARNLRYGQRRAAPGPIAFDAVVDLLGIAALLDRRPHSLSGGERQRVAIGRALLAQPRLLLMDEPLASLDEARKAEILPFLIRLKTTLNLPVIYVTHAIEEVLRLADAMVMIEDGKVVASGPIADMAGRADLPLARRDDAGALVACTVAGHDTQRAMTRLAGLGTTFLVPLLDYAPGTALRVRIPAREVILAGKRPEAISVQNVLEGRVRRILAEASRHAMLVEVALPGGDLLSRVTPDAVFRLGLVEGGPVLALVKSTSIEVLAS